MLRSIHSSRFENASFTYLENQKNVNFYVFWRGSSKNVNKRNQKNSKFHNYAFADLLMREALGYT